MDSEITKSEIKTSANNFFPTARRDYIFFLLTVVSTLLSANGIYAGGYALGFSMGAIALLATAFCYLRKGFHYSLISTIGLATSIILILSFVIHQSTAFAFFKLLFLILSASVLFVSAYGVKAPELGDFRALFAPLYLLCGVSLPSIRITTRSLASKKFSSSKEIGRILLSLLLSAPLLAILTFLLVYADTAFEYFFDSINLNLGEIFYTVILGAIILICVFPLLFVTAKNAVPLKKSARKPFLSVLDVTSANTVLSAVSLLYIVFLLSQGAYLSGGFMGLLPEDLSYSAYARRGFFEMCAVCVINLGIIFLSELFTIRNGEMLPKTTRALNTFISTFSIFLITSAIAKMLMYIRTYGLTFLRLGTSVFMLLLFFVFVSLILKNLIKGFKAMPTVFAAACIIMSFTAICEPYNVIAKYNLYAYESGMMDEYELDTNYLAHNCGAYGASALIKLSKDSNVFVSNRAKEQLKNIHPRYRYNIGRHDIREFSVARSIVESELIEYYSK